MGAELPDPRTRFLAQERIYSDTERHREGEQFNDTRKYGGRIRKDDTRKRSAARNAARGQISSSSRGQGHDDGIMMVMMASTQRSCFAIFSNFQKSNLCGMKVPFTGEHNRLLESHVWTNIKII
jgi:hypothetical protein